MIHSLAGGVIGKELFLDFAFVEILDEFFLGNKAWYISKNNIKPNDLVQVSYKGCLVTAKVVRVDKNVSSYASPIPIKMAKQIIKKIEV